MPRVKICGITNLDDALAACAAGADYLGFIFHPPSRRNVRAETVRDIVVHLRAQAQPPVLVGVFVNADVSAVRETLDYCSLDLAQLSGDEPPWSVGDPRSPLYGRAYKALRPQSTAEAAADAEWFAAPASNPHLPTLLLDSYHPGLYGGSGTVGDWALAAQVASQIPRLMLAGGLTPANVAAAVRRVRPFAVDVAGGVEAAPGRKDHAALRAFITAAISAE